MTQSNVIPFAPPAENLIERIAVATEQLRDVPLGQIASARLDNEKGEEVCGRRALYEIAQVLLQISAAAGIYEIMEENT